MANDKNASSVPFLLLNELQVRLCKNKTLSVEWILLSSLRPFYVFIVLKNLCFAIIFSEIKNPLFGICNDLLSIILFPSFNCNGSMVWCWWDVKITYYHIIIFFFFLPYFVVFFSSLFILLAFPCTLGMDWCAWMSVFLFAVVIVLSSVAFIVLSSSFA